MALRRGFKAEAERLASDLWSEMDLQEANRMDAVALAEHVGCVVRAADELVDIQKLKELKRVQNNAFFACTFELPGDRYGIVFNPLMSDARRNSDVAHEVAHILLKHRLSRLEHLGEVAFLSCDQQQEEEAGWLAGCLLLPRLALIHDLKRQMKHETIAKNRILSEEMVEYRVRVTGVARQLAASRRKRTE